MNGAHLSRVTLGSSRRSRIALSLLLKDHNLHQENLNFLILALDALVQNQDTQPIVVGPDYEIK